MRGDSNYLIQTVGACHNCSWERQPCRNWRDIAWKLGMSQPRAFEVILYDRLGSKPPLADRISVTRRPYSTAMLRINTMHSRLRSFDTLQHMTVIYTWRTTRLKFYIVKFWNWFSTRKSHHDNLDFKFHRVLNVGRFLLGYSPAYEIYMPTLRNTLFHLHRHAGAYLPAYEDGTECSETSAYKFQTPGNHPKESIQHTMISLCVRIFCHPVQHVTANLI